MLSIFKSKKSKVDSIEEQEHMLLVIRVDNWMSEAPFEELEKVVEMEIMQDVMIVNNKKVDMDKIPILGLGYSRSDKKYSDMKAKQIIDNYKETEIINKAKVDSKEASGIDTKDSMESEDQEQQKRKTFNLKKKVSAIGTTVRDWMDLVSLGITSIMHVRC